MSIVNGRFAPERDARDSIDDSALVMAEIVFEVTRTFLQRRFRLAQHLDRLDESSKALDIHLPLTISALETPTLETLERNLPNEPATVDWNIIHNVHRDG